MQNRNSNCLLHAHFIPGNKWRLIAVSILCSLDESNTSTSSHFLVCNFLVVINAFWLFCYVLDHNKSAPSKYKDKYLRVLISSPHGILLFMTDKIRDQLLF